MSRGLRWLLIALAVFQVAQVTASVIYILQNGS